MITIQGTGFSATPANNTVTFNGTAATVASWTTISLVVPVAAGATTGTIAVTIGGGSATSSAAFTVTATSGAPTITSFTPAIGLPGEATTITGTNFELVPANNKVSFYGLPQPRPKALVSASTATTLSTAVPPNTRSGPVTLATPGGNNARADLPLTPHQASAGVQAFTQVFRNGEQVWVLVRAGQIVNAGVNASGAHY